LNKKNLSTKAADIDNLFTISSFRSSQYDLIEYFMNLCVEYVAKQNKNYMKVDKVSIYNIPTYLGINYNLLTQVIVDIDVLGVGKKTFMKFLLPTLVDDTFFILNENYFVPTIYILDKPIIIKKKSIKLTGTFNSITIYDKLVTFVGVNIPAMYFLDIFLSNTDLEEAKLKSDFATTFEINPTTISESDLLTYFSNIFKCDPYRTVIKDHFHKLFFDSFSKILYQQCYNLKEEELSIAELLKIALDIERYSDEDTFIDLSQKRLVFIEILLSPIFKRMAIMASRASRGFVINEIVMDQMELVKNFYINLHNKFIYDNVNAFDTMLSHKTHLLSPNAENAPGVIANLHPSHFKKICPISVSSQNPGETVYTIADAKCDIFGNFYEV
jgi:hypothetical protein